MKKIEFAKTVCKTENILIGNLCPVDLECGTEDMNIKTTILDNLTNKVIGCNNTTCEECWNKEYEVN